MAPWTQGSELQYIQQESRLENERTVLLYCNVFVCVVLEHQYPCALERGVDAFELQYETINILKVRMQEHFIYF